MSGYEYPWLLLVPAASKRDMRALAAHAKVMGVKGGVRYVTKEIADKRVGELFAGMKEVRDGEGGGDAEEVAE